MASVMMWATSADGRKPIGSDAKHVDPLTEKKVEIFE